MFAMACMLYEVDSCIRGFHMYQDTWTPLVGEESVVKLGGVSRCPLVCLKYLKRAMCSLIKHLINKKLNRIMANFNLTTENRSAKSPN